MKQLTNLYKLKNPTFSLLVVIGVDGVLNCKRQYSKSLNLKKAKENVILVELDFPRRTKIDPNILQQNRELARLFAVKVTQQFDAVPEPNNDKVNFNKLGSLGFSS